MTRFHCQENSLFLYLAKVNKMFTQLQRNEKNTLPFAYIPQNGYDELNTGRNPVFVILVVNEVP